MSEQAILLVLTSAAIHAAWNLYSKSSGDPVSFLLRALAFSALLYSPLFVWMQFHVSYTLATSLCLLASGICCGLYFFSLGKAYQHGQVSIAYPIARSFPILVITFASLFLGEVPNLQGASGVLAVVLGCFVLPWQRFTRGPGGFSLPSYWNRSVLWAVGAAGFTAGFSLLDKVAATQMQDLASPSIWDKINYVYLQNLIAWLVVAACVRTSRYKLLPVGRQRPLVCGALFLISYSLILLALATDPVAYVVSFRQLSIVFATLISMFLLERTFAWPRLVGVMMIFTGVVLVGLA